MALYFSSARRARRSAGIAIAAAVLAFLAGWAFGRQQVPSIEGRVASLQREAAAIAIGIERLDIEYEEMLGAGGADTVEASVVVPLDELRVRLQRAMDGAPWLAPSSRAELLDSLAAVRSSAKAGATIETFQSSSAEAGQRIRDSFGATRP